jgi:hypothetical protein
LGSYREFLWTPLPSPTFSLLTGQWLDFHQLADYHASRTAPLALRFLYSFVADRGYFNGEEILACDKEKITAVVPKCVTSGAKAAGRFDKADFIYKKEDNEYQCPAGQRLIWRYSTVEREMQVHRCWGSSCQQCAIKAECTTGKQRRITRWEHEDVLEAMQTRLDQAPESMRLRRQTVEHPFGTLKAWMGATHFLTKQLKNVSTEMTLHVLAYNLKRVMNILGTTTLMEAMVA